MSGTGRHIVIAAGGTGGHMVPAHVLGEALKAASRLNVGQGIGPVHHFHAWW